MIIVARYDSECPICRLLIKAGSKVEWQKGSKARHLSCLPKPPKLSTCPNHPHVELDLSQWSGSANGHCYLCLESES